MMIQPFNLVLLAVLLLAYWLLPKYLVARVEAAAKGAVDEQVGKSLAEHTYKLDKQLETHRHALQQNAESLRQELHYQKERFSRDYSLFAAKRNEIYAEIYSHLERAHGLYAPHFSMMTFKPILDSAGSVNLLAFADREPGLNEGERDDLRALVARDVAAAGKLATELSDKASIRNASRAFTEFKNAAALNSLYLSPEVESLLFEAARELAKLFARADEKREGEHIDYEARQGLLDNVATVCQRVRHTMAQEMRAGFAPNN